MIVRCLVCDKEENVIPSRAKKYKTCSYKCMGVYKKAKSNINCDNCLKSFHKKKQLLEKHTHHFCSRKCLGEYREKQYRGKNNPNFKNRQVDQDGYKIVDFGYIRDKEHKIVTLNYLSLKNIPKGFHIHHKDCNRLNNSIENLALLSISDHKWLHSQYGSAVLWAYMNNKISVENLIDWSNDKERTKRLLPLCIKQQIGVFKSDELRETPEVDNPEPS